MTNILAIDPGRHWGMARLYNDERIVLAHPSKGADKDNSPWPLVMMEFANAFERHVGPGVAKENGMQVWIEHPFYNKKYPQAGLTLWKFVGVVEEHSYDYLDVHMVQPNVWKSHVCGNGKAPDKDVIKTIHMLYPGIKQTMTKDEACALGILHYALAHNKAEKIKEGR